MDLILLRSWSALIGAILILVSNTMTTRGFRVAWSPRDWKPIWKQRAEFRAGGWWCFWIGWSALLLSCGLWLTEL